jgi:hypothetical protein
MEKVTVGSHARPLARVISGSKDVLDQQYPREHPTWKSNEPAKISMARKSIRKITKNQVAKKQRPRTPQITPDIIMHGRLIGQQTIGEPLADHFPRNTPEHHCGPDWTKN